MASSLWHIVPETISALKWSCNWSLRLLSTGNGSYRNCKEKYQIDSASATDGYQSTIKINYLLHLFVEALFRFMNKNYCFPMLIILWAPCATHHLQDVSDRIINISLSFSIIIFCSLQKHETSINWNQMSRRREGSNMVEEIIHVATYISKVFKSITEAPTKAMTLKAFRPYLFIFLNRKRGHIA